MSDFKHLETASNLNEQKNPFDQLAQCLQSLSSCVQEEPGPEVAKVLVNGIPNFLRLCDMPNSLRRYPDVAQAISLVKEQIVEQLINTSFVYNIVTELHTATRREEIDREEFMRRRPFTMFYDVNRLLAADDGKAVEIASRCFQRYVTELSRFVYENQSAIIDAHECISQISNQQPHIVNRFTPSSVTTTTTISGGSAVSHGVGAASVGSYNSVLNTNIFMLVGTVATVSALVVGIKLMYGKSGKTGWIS